MANQRLLERYNDLMEIFNEIKEEVREMDKNLYERWRASGFQVTEEFVSMYPNLCEVLETLDEDEEEEED